MSPLTVLRALTVSVAVLAAYLPASFADMPSFALNNTAVAGLRIPALGVGTGYDASLTMRTARSACLCCPPSRQLE